MSHERISIITAFGAFFAGAAVMYSMSLVFHTDTRMETAAAATPVVQVEATTTTTSAYASASSTEATTTEDQATSTQQQDGPVAHQYKLLTNVDVCTLNTLGKDGWQPIQYGQNADGADSQSDTVRDENCKGFHKGISIPWVLFERIAI